MGMVEKKGYRLKKENKNGSAVLPFAIGKRFVSFSSFFAVVSLDLTKQSFGEIDGFCQLCCYDRIQEINANFAGELGGRVRVTAKITFVHVYSRTMLQKEDVLFLINHLL